MGAVIRAGLAFRCGQEPAKVAAMARSWPAVARNHGW